VPHPRDCSGGLAVGNAVTSLKEPQGLVCDFACVYLDDISHMGSSGCSDEVKIMSLPARSAFFFIHNTLAFFQAWALMSLTSLASRLLLACPWILIAARSRSLSKVTSQVSCPMHHSLKAFMLSPLSFIASSSS